MISHSAGHVRIALVLTIVLTMLLAMPRASSAQGDLETSGQPATTINATPEVPEDPASVGSGWKWVGAITSLAGLVAGGAMMKEGVTNDKTDPETARLLLVVGASGFGLAFLGTATQAVGLHLRRNAFLQAGYETDGTMVLPWTLVLLGGAMAAGGIAMTGIGVSSKSTNMGIGGGFLALGGCLVGVIGVLVAPRSIDYELPSHQSPTQNLRLHLSIRPSIAEAHAASRW
jgi:hypothetical protein